MKFGSLVAGITAATMVLAPVAAQAGTSASASVVKPVYGSRTTTSVDKKQKATAGAYVLGALALGAAGFGLYKAIDNGNDKSNGSN
ncbi:hypothetical protein ACLIMP_05680 [Novosphingobium aerophilum]|uniref:hypothetical protein n=1 Tax=Novosphingobium TaxID=165696 RepID=UPI0006C8A742|nr:MULTISPECIES: hypothetical protein [unclassified Novosphingobium]KPH65741.1 hypothetical protein ADT71_10200 [Novosphingobium sp. ST904]MPS70284.1 hypothetical protein [Novosphingobium sp.]TCM37312.1 hypothetical protein EDF59_11120 [Novosphingobium sp. ST904]WRT93727.1 hypothetical protein U9J33_04225 [Novosphingobium sp. RL4]